jgi:hypothetical protein
LIHWADSALIVRRAQRMSEASEQLKARTMRFALDICRLIKELPIAEPGPTVRRQLASL